MKSFQEVNQEYLARTLALKEPGPDGTIFPPYAAGETLAEKISGLRVSGLIKKLSAKHATDKKNGIFSLISDALFYLALLVIILSIFSSGLNSGAPKSAFGYAFFTVVSRSMQDEIPKGSFILVKQTKDIEVGDTITFMRDFSTSVTHKVIAVYENYENTGFKGFQTKGVNNLNPDATIVHELNVVGKVIFVLPGAGAMFSYLKANLHIVLIIFGLSLIFSFSIRGLFVKPAWKRAARKPELGR